MEISHSVITPNENSGTHEKGEFFSQQHAGNFGAYKGRIFKRSLSVELNIYYS